MPYGITLPSLNNFSISSDVLDAVGIAIVSFENLLVIKPTY